MPDVKSRAGSLRDERAAVTRARITDAARRLFREHGYGATTLIDVAREAGVAVQTVYAVYGSKPGVLGALRDGVVAQPDADALFGEALGEADPARALGLFARSIRLRWEHGADVVAIHRDAASADRTVRSEVARVLAIRRSGLGRLIRSLGDAPGSGADEKRATAILDALTMPEIYLELVEVHGWTPDAYEAWLRDALTQQVLR